MTNMQFIKTRNVKSPERDVKENAGIDCYIPELDNKFIADLAAKSKNLVLCSDIDGALQAAMARKTFMITSLGEIYIAPGEDIIIPSGIHSKFNNNLALIANNKSGIATKRKLDFGASVIDASYTGEWHFNMVNRSNNYQKVCCGEKIIQFIPHVISTDPVEVLDMSFEDFYKDTNSKRGSDWAGSTGVR